MLEGLAVWALFIYLLRLVGIPWTKPFKLFAYGGGSAWLLFVWVGLITWAPMDLSGGSVVQSPHIQLRPGSTRITGSIDKLHISPNQELKQGQLVYEINNEPYKIAVGKSQALLAVAEMSYRSAVQDANIADTNYQVSLEDIDIIANQISAARQDLELKERTLQRFVKQNTKVKNTVAESNLDQQKTVIAMTKNQIEILKSQHDKALINEQKSKNLLAKSQLTIKSKQADIASKQSQLNQAMWDLSQTKVYAPVDGYVTNFIAREGQFIGATPRLKMYSNEKFVLMRINHQAFRNIRVGQEAEFASAIYPGKVFSAVVEGIVEATGESQGSLVARETNVRATTGKNVQNKHHFVRLSIHEPAGYDIPVGAVGLAWVNAEKPIPFLNFLNVIRGIIIRMKAQIYYIYSM
ncbi:multidrug transporter [Vibrio sp. 10N.286.49.C2]|uniref:HlyD family secretion protein n=1 Tax=unclassified Vibrio TaxID=2614977 RepID=UPI000C82D5BD|nr:MULTISPECIES: efflux RND transporter periplasmic adaptor subunit [unclassified Vibrio]PMH38849.1 multidrug transporter [Vibrio sp. 10N.286.49.C2]PMH55325.1 multidrug transporter [Vibrio sp. 10N.286.49.B1]PMH83780.1 multidrug transporter [Vibrio sp. 10N.286.48.B7]